MKINILVPFTAPTGGIRVMFLYSNYFVSKGHDVVCYVPMKAYKFSNKPILKVVKSSLGNVLKRGSKVNWFNCNFKIKLVPVISNTFVRDADISIATAWPTAYDLNMFKESKGKKVYFVQGYETWSGDKKEVEDTYRFSLNKVVITKELQKKMLDNFKEESHIVYNGLDSNEFISEEKISNENIKILMLYNRASNKGTIEGIDVLKRIKEKYKNVHIRLFGFKKGNNIPSDFEFFENPERKDLINLYRESDIYVFPSKKEAWGLPVMEAMANKCAVVGNNVGCVKELCTNGENALIVDNLDYKVMEEKIEELINNRELLIKIQNGGYELAKDFKWENSFKKFEGYLKSLI